MSARVSSQTASSLKGTLGIAASYDIQINRDLVVTPSTSLYYQREFLDAGYSIPVQLTSGTGTKLNCDVGAGGRNIAGASIGASVRYRDRYSAFASLGAQVSETQRSASVTVGLGVGF
jgi:outer membrane autotransporter protein